MDRKLIYLFSEANGQMRELLGGKGANLAEMTVLGLPVPQGFTITTEACNMYYENGERLPESLERNIYDYVAKLEHIKNSVLPKIRCLCRSVPAPAHQCPA